MEPRRLLVLGLLVAAAGYAAWTPMVMTTFGAGPRLAGEAVTVATLLAAAWLVQGKRSAAWLALPWALLAVTRGALLAADFPPLGPRLVPDGALVLGLGAMVLAALDARWLRPGAVLAAAGALSWFPIQVLDGHLGWSTGTLLQTAGWILVAVAAEPPRPPQPPR